MTPAPPRELTVCLGQAARVVGQLSYFRQGPREASSFSYDPAWLAATDRFTLSPDLALVAERQYRKAPSKIDSVFHLALADTAPNGWGRRVITRDHARRRQGEVLALQLAKAAGIDAAIARVVHAGGDRGAPVALIRRFDRLPDGSRIPYLSAASMLQASREDERAYAEIADAILANGTDPRTDCHELWRRIVFSLLITNVDDHLQNHGFLHAMHGQWRLLPKSWLIAIP